MEETLLAAFDGADAAGADANGALRFAQMLDLPNLGKQSARPIAEPLAGVAAASTAVGDYFGARAYYDVAGRALVQIPGLGRLVRFYRYEPEQKH